MVRRIHSDAIGLLDKLLQKNALAQDSIRKKRARQLFVEATKSCIGIKEISSNKGFEVELFQKTVGLSKGDSWCMAFMQTCIAYAEHKTGITSAVHAAGGCVNVWQRTPEILRVKVNPLAGAIAIWQHTDDPIHGHTGMVLDCYGTSFHAIEGNTSEGLDNLNNKVGQTGDGVRFTHRRYDMFNKTNGDMLLLGSLKPF
jgi:CHAP domain